MSILIINFEYIRGGSNNAVFMIWKDASIVIGGAAPEALGACFLIEGEQEFLMNRMIRRDDV